MSLANSQWRPVTAAEVGTDDGLSVRVCSDLQDGLNNAKHHALVNPLRAELCFPPWTSRDTTTTQHVIAIFAPVYVPDGYNRVRWHICHRRVAGTATVTWRLRVHWGLYVGDQITFEADKLIGYSNSSTINTTSDSWERDFDTLGFEVDETDELLWFFITAQNGDAVTRAEITGLKIVPYAG